MTEAELILLRFCTSEGPWEVKPYEDDSGWIGIADKDGNEICSMDGRQPNVQADFTAIAWEKTNAYLSQQPPKSPRPWRVERCLGLPDETWVRVVAADGTEVCIAPDFKQARIDLLWIAHQMNQDDIERERLVKEGE